MSLTEAVRENRQRIAQINDTLTLLQQQIAVLQAEKADLKSDNDDMLAYLQTKGITP